MATIKKGTYRFNDELTPPDGYIYLPSINLTVIGGTYDGESITAMENGINTFSIFVSDGRGFSSWVDAYHYTDMDGAIGWNIDGGLTATVTKDIEADDAFSTWFEENTKTATAYVIKYLVPLKQSLGNGYDLYILIPANTPFGDLIERDGVQYLGFGNGYGSFSVTGKLNDSAITDIVISEEINGSPVTSIAFESFFGSNITSIFIPASVTRILGYVFYNCLSLTSITYGGTIDQWAWGAYHLFDNTDVPVTEVICADGAVCFEGSNDLIRYKLSDDGTYYTVLSPALSGAENLILASYIRGIPVTHISDAAFYDLYDFTSVTLPSALKSIGGSAFAYSDIGRSIEIPDSVTYIGDSAFKNTGLTSVVIPEGVTIINAETFMNCYSLASVTIPKSVTSIAQDAFYDCSSLTDVYYSGTEEEWNALDISDGNDALLNATIHL